MPGDYTFVGGDAGVYVASALTFQTTGTWTVSVADAGSGVTTATGNVTVNPAGLGSLTLTNIASSTTTGVAETLIVTAYDTLSNVKTDYVGTVLFSSTDTAAAVPGTYTFVSGDLGIATFVGGVTQVSPAARMSIRQKT
jgi:hypothetical protein